MWKAWKINDEIIYTVNDFDGHYKMTGIVTEVTDDHAIVTIDDMHLWVDDDTEYMFE